MAAWSFSTIRPKLDAFFASVRLSLEARASDGVDRRRLEDFLSQAENIQERLYVCLESDDRSTLPQILKDVQVMAYRTRVLFGTPLPGVAWENLQALFDGMPSSGGAALRVLDGKQAASFASGELRESRREPWSRDRVLVAPVPSGGSGELLGRDSHPIPETPPAPESPIVDAGDLVASAVTLASPLPEPPDSSGSAEPPGPPVSGLSDPVAVIPPPAEEQVVIKRPPLEGLAVVTGWAFRIPFLMEVLVFLLGGIGAYALGGIHPTLTALAGGLAAIMIFRAAPATLRYNDEAPEVPASPDIPVHTP